MGGRRAAMRCVCTGTPHARAILFCNIMLDSSSTRLDILDVIGSNLLYRLVSTIEACRRHAILRPLSPTLVASTMRVGTTDIFPGIYFRTDSYGEIQWRERERECVSRIGDKSRITNKTVNKILWKHSRGRKSGAYPFRPWPI